MPYIWFHQGVARTKVLECMMLLRVSLRQKAWQAYFQTKLSKKFAQSADLTSLTLDRQPHTNRFWVAVKELKLSYHNGYIRVYIVNTWGSPIWYLRLSSLTATQDSVEPVRRLAGLEARRDAGLGLACSKCFRV